MKIRAKILSGYIFVCVVFVVMVIGGYFVTIRTTDLFTSRVSETLRAEEVLDDLRFAALRVVASSLEYAWLIKQKGANAAAAGEQELIGDGESRYRVAVQRMATVTLAEPEKDHAGEIVTAGDRLLAVSRRFVAAARAGHDDKRIEEIKEEFERAETDFLERVNHAMAEEDELYAAKRAEMDNVIGRAFVTIGCLALLMLFVAAGGAVAVANRIAAPIQRLREAAERLALGDRSVAVRRESADEVGDLAESFTVMAAARGNAERKLELQATELAERNEELKSFAYVTSHDLREPLVTMRGFSGELKLALKEVDDVLVSVLPLLDDRKRMLIVDSFQYEIPEAFRYIEASISQMETQIYSIQQLSQLGHLEIVLRPVDTAEIMNTLLRDFEDNLRAAGGEIRVGAMPVVQADRGVLFQIIGHLLENAIKYRDPIRPLVVTVEVVEGTAETVFHVRDTGRGIPGDDVNRVFNMFRSVGVTEKGKGMGLTYVKALVRRLGGRIWCVSREGEGSTFSFTVPVVDQERRPAPEGGAVA